MNEFFENYSFHSSIGNSTSIISIIDSFTSGRMLIWEHDLYAFFETEITNQLFGNGFNFSYIVNDIRSGVAIWAHSDFVSILLSLGFCGLLVYIYILLKVFISSAYLSKKLQFSLISYILFPAFFLMDFICTNVMSLVLF